MKKLLVVVDYQNDFVDGDLGFAGAELLYPNILKVINQYKEEKQAIVFIKDTHFQNYLETEEGKHLPIKHCIKGTSGHDLYKDLETISKKYPTFEKETFGSKELLHYLEKNHYDEVTFVGLVTNICIISNAIIAKSALPNAHIKVIKSAVGSYDKVTEEKTFDVLVNLHVELV